MKCSLIIFFAFWSQVVCSQTYNLTISIPNLNSREGEIQIGIYNRKDAFPLVDKQYKVFYVKVDKFTGSYIVKDLPKGEYAVALMHDENADKICNTNFLGIPKEGYGFSKNVKPILSAPSFDDCKFYLNQNMSITIKLIY
jgi:uncharacterized protein (DUF2141 family)